MKGSTRLLIRTTALDDRVLAFADELSAASGCPVAFVADERQGPIPTRGRDVVGLSQPACEALGLYVPADFAWKCGDYGYYLARRRFPEAEWFWMIEYDVRFGGGDLAEFFAFFAAQSTVDFIAPLFEPAGLDWFWTQTLSARDARPYRCLFPVTRLSARGVEAALAKRARHSGNPFRRMIWPNDEAFVATTLANGDFVCRDFNSFGRTLYSPDTFTFAAPIDGRTFEPGSGGLRMFHPVLYDEAYARKVAKLEAPPFVMPTVKRSIRKVAREINGLSAW